MEVKSCLEINGENSLYVPLSKLKLTEQACIKSDSSNKMEESDIQHNIYEKNITHEIEENLEKNFNHFEDPNEEIVHQHNDGKDETEKDVDETLHHLLTTIQGKNLPLSVEARKVTGQEQLTNTQEAVLIPKVVEYSENVKNNISASESNEIKYEGIIANVENEKLQVKQTKDLSKNVLIHNLSCLCENHKNQAHAFSASKPSSITNTVKSEQIVVTNADIQEAVMYSEGNSLLKNIENNDIDEIAFEVTDDALADKIVRQVEFYFSDFNLLKNNYLMKHIKRGKDGFVSLKMIGTFRKIRFLTKDLRVVAYSLMRSTELELNDTNTKIRRKEPLPKIRDTNLGKSIVAFNLPQLCQTNENLQDLFSKFGNIIKAEILTTKSKDYNVYHRRCIFRNQEIASRTFGLVEFEKYEDSIKALKDEDGHLPKENKMQVVPLTAQIHRSFFRRARNHRYRSSNRRGGARFNSKSEHQSNKMNSAVVPDGEVQEKQWNGEKNYRRYYPRHYPRNIMPSPDIKGVKKFSSDPLQCCEKKHAFTEYRQLKTNNSLNISKGFNGNQQPKVLEKFSSITKPRVASA